MTNWYWIYADIDGEKRWHMVFDRQPGLFFVASDFEEEEYDIEEYKKDFPDNEVVPVKNAHQTKHPLGICEDHKEIWNRMDCPLCDALFLYERLRLSLEVMGDALELLSAIPDTGSVDSDEDQDESNRGQACIMLEKFLDYARLEMVGETCTCDEIGESRCPKHGWENMMANLRWAKKGKGA